MKNLSRADVLKDLQADILRLQGFKSLNNDALDMGLGSIKNAFPNGSFPLGVMHEFLFAQKENAASSSGFVAGLLSALTKNNGVVLWIGSSRTLFPPALKSFGVEPDRFIFIDLQKEKDVLWAMEEALKCNALSAVVGETREIDFTASRRLQLAAEQSRVTGFILRNKDQNVNTTACVSRWKITSLPSELDHDLPGIGFPTWRVELLKIRNGKPAVWNIQWMNGRFVPVYNSAFISHVQQEAG